MSCKTIGSRLYVSQFIFKLTEALINAILWNACELTNSAYVYGSYAEADKIRGLRGICLGRQRWRATKLSQKTRQNCRKNVRFCCGFSETWGDFFIFLSDLFGDGAKLLARRAALPRFASYGYIPLSGAVST